MAVLLLLYKHSFMRQDIAHVHMDRWWRWRTAILFAPIVWPRAGRAGRIMCVTVIAVAGVVTYFDPLLLHRQDPAGICDECAATMSR